MASTRLLLFGSPGAGKTALLQAVEKVSGPFSSALTVLDCDGKSALKMLEAEEPFTIKHPMRKPILDADAVVLVVDVSAPNKQMNEDFRQSARWLKHLHEARGRRTDIADLPVYFVLTKCDLLAKKEDTLEAWKNRLGEAKHQYEENFRKYLKQHEPGFGTIKLKVLTSAIKHPNLADRPAKAQEPFGVAELFSECVQSASEFQERRQTSQSRVQNVLAGLFGLVALLVLSVAFLYEFQPPPRGTTLDELVQLALPKPTATPAERLGGTIKKLEDRQAKLDEIAASSEFTHLPADTQTEVTRYQGELTAYLQFQQRSQTELKLPHLAKNDAEFKELEKAVRGYVFPEAYAKDWADTRLGRRSQQVQREYDALHEELKKESAWLDNQIDANKKLLIAGAKINVSLLELEKDARQLEEAWQQKFRAQTAARSPMPGEQEVPGVTRLIYDDLAKFEPVRTSKKEWEKSQDKLRVQSLTLQESLKTLP